MYNIKTLTNHELHKVSKEVIIKKFKEYGVTAINRDRTISISNNTGLNIEVLVKSIRRPTEYVLIYKEHMDAKQQNLYVALVIYSGTNDPELFLIPSSAFLAPNDLLRDRPNYKIPEYGMNVSNKNMPLLMPYDFDRFINKLLRGNNDEKNFNL